MSDQDPDATRVERVVDEPTAVFAVEGTGGPPTAGIPPVFDPPPPPPDRRPWIIAAVLGLIVLLLVLLLVLQGDDDDDGDVDASSTTTTALATSTTTSTSTTAPASTTTAAAPSTTSPIVTVPPAECAEAGEGPAEPALAAEAVHDAWVRGDRACADELMTSDALDELFSRDGTGADEQLQGCTEEDQPDPHVDCAFTYEGGSTHYLMSYSANDRWQVFDISQTAD